MGELIVESTQTKAFDSRMDSLWTYASIVLYLPLGFTLKLYETEGRSRYRPVTGSDTHIGRRLKSAAEGIAKLDKSRGLNSLRLSTCEPFFLLLNNCFLY
jgi:hypothetical protein